MVKTVLSGVTKKQLKQRHLVSVSVDPVSVSVSPQKCSCFPLDIDTRPAVHRLSSQFTIRFRCHHNIALLTSLAHCLGNTNEYHELCRRRRQLCPGQDRRCSASPPGPSRHRGGKGIIWLRGGRDHVRWRRCWCGSSHQCYLCCYPLPTLCRHAQLATFTLDDVKELGTEITAIEGIENAQRYAMTVPVAQVLSTMPIMNAQLTKGEH